MELISERGKRFGANNLRIIRHGKSLMTQYYTINLQIVSQKEKL
jgi:hypothetical protein